MAFKNRKYILQISGVDVEDFEDPKKENQWEQMPFQHRFIRNAGKRGRSRNVPYWLHGT